MQGEAMVERPLHRTPTCLSGEWDAVQDRAPQGGPSLSTAIACENAFGREWLFSPTPLCGVRMLPPSRRGSLV